MLAAASGTGGTTLGLGSFSLDSTTADSMVEWRSEGASEPGVRTDDAKARSRFGLHVETCIHGCSFSKELKVRARSSDAGFGRKSAPNAKLRRVLASKRTEWHTIRKMASKMLDKNYTLSQFTQDLAAFPELSLYLRDGVMETGSGRTTDDEYQRTVCAFFAIYWLSCAWTLMVGRASVSAQMSAGTP